MNKLLLVLSVLLLTLTGCSTSQCDVAKKSLATANAAYNVALQSGDVVEIQRYGWTLSAAQATLDIWCAGQPAEGTKE